MEENKEYTPEEFAIAYKELILKYGYEIKPQIVGKQQIDGTYTLEVRLTITKLDNRN